MIDHPQFDDEIRADMVRDFLDESSQLVELIGSRCLEFENELHARGLARLPLELHESMLNEVFRATHTLKGASSMLGFAGVKRLTHQMEDALDSLRSGRSPLGGPAIEILLCALDRLESFLESVRDRDGEPTNVDDEFNAWLERAIAQLEAPDLSPTSQREPIIAPADSDRTAPQEPPPLAAELPPAAASRRDAGVKSPQTIRVDFERLNRLVALAGELSVNRTELHKELDGLRSLFCERPPANLARDIQVRLSILREELTANELSVESLETARIRIDRLSVDFSAWHLLLDQLERGRLRFHEMAAGIERLAFIADGIQKGVIAAQMAPVESLFFRFRRVVRDMSHELGKEVALDIAGEKTELERRTLDSLGDPLIHMIRNAVDHGIETPAERLAAGKPRAGTIRLFADHAGENVVIVIADDGRGLNPERLKARALEKQLIGPADAAGMCAQDAIDLIFRPGFSTAAQVTDISGRGVGMDIVKSKIDELNGTLCVRSQLGAGTTFEIRLPAAPAAIPIMAVEAGGDAYALPLEFVEEILELADGDIHATGDGQVIESRGRIVPLRRLYEALRRGSADQSAPVDAVRDLSFPCAAVVISSPSKRVAFLVDRCLSKEVAAMSPPACKSTARGLSGSCTLSDGRIAAVIDATALLDSIEPDAHAFELEA